MAKLNYTVNDEVETSDTATKIEVSGLTTDRSQVAENNSNSGVAEEKLEESPSE